MASKKKRTTVRIQRDDAIDALLDDGEDHLTQLLQLMEKKHANGGIFKNKEHYQKTQDCMQALSEEELNDDI